MMSAMSSLDATTWPLTPLDRAFADVLQDAQPSPDPRHALLAALVSHQFGRGHACLDLVALQAQPERLLGWSPLPSAWPVAMTEAAATLPWTQGEASPLVLEDSRLYLRRNWQAEQSIRNGLAARLAQPNTVPADLKTSLDRLFPPDPSLPGPDWQKIACALAARQRFTLITGGPGTGKTTTVVRLLALLQADPACQGRPLRIELAAPTGKAAARLTESIASSIGQLPPDLRHGMPTQASTLHKLLGVRGPLAADRVPALAVDVVVVDEASMIDLDMMARLLAAVPLSARLILLGDKDQLASVEAGAVMGQLCADAHVARYDADTRHWIEQMTGFTLPAADRPGGALAQQTVMLRHSRRFDSRSGIGRWAAAVNLGRPAGGAEQVPTVRALWEQAPDVQAVQGDVTRLVPTTPHDPRWLALVQQGWHNWLCTLQAVQGPFGDAQALQALADFRRFQVLCAVREGPWGVAGLNQRIARHLGFDGAGWYAGRPVMVTRNDYSLGLMNGDVGLCLPRAGGLRVAFPDSQGGVRWVQPSRLDAVEDVFAMTVHKSQGSEFDTVCLVLPDRPSPVLTSELIYTGITRAKTRLHWVVPQPVVLWQAAAQRVQRSGGLAAQLHTNALP